METLSQIKAQVLHLFQTNPRVHINISNKRNKLCLCNAPAVITAIYPNIFTIRLEENNTEKTYSIQYSEILTHTVEIAERKLLTD